MSSVISDNESRTEVQRLVDLAARGDHHAYSELVERYKESLFRVGLRILRRPADAEDAVQEAFIKAYVHLGSYRAEYSFYTWVCAILTNHCYSVLRARDWRVGGYSDQMFRGLRSSEPADDPETVALLRSRDEILSRAIQALPDRYRSVLLLRYGSDLTYQEVADATGLSMGAVKTQIRRATILLREALAGRQLELTPEAT